MKDVDASIYRWPQCVSGGDLGSKLVVFILHTADKLELIDFFYLSDMLWKGGDVEEALRIITS